MTRSAGGELPRPWLLAAALERARRGAPLVVTGPPGAGKTTLLLRVAEALRAEGWQAVYLDLMGAASSPERFVATALRALPAAAFGPRLPQADEIRRLAASGRANGASAVHSLLGLWASLDQAAGRPVALFLDEATEIRSLAYFAGLREVDRPFAAALVRRGRGTLLATSYGTQARRLWPGLEFLEVPPVTPAELAPLLRNRDLAIPAEAVLRAGAGWPRYVQVLLDRLGAGDGVEQAWVDEMASGGRLERLCRHTYEVLLLRSRGYGMSKAVLAAVADEEGLNLTALVERLGRSPGAVRDYLGWLVGVDALRMVRKRYYYVDRMVRFWVRLHARGVPPTEGDLRRAAAEAVAGDDTESAGVAAEAEIAAVAAAPAAGRADHLMEID